MRGDGPVRPDAILDVDGREARAVPAPTRPSRLSGDRWIHLTPGALALQVTGALYPRDVLAVRYRAHGGGYESLYFELGGRAAPGTITAPTPAAALRHALAIEGETR